MKNYDRKIFMLDKENLQIINNLSITNDNSLAWDISSFNSQFFIVALWKRDEYITFQIYEIKTLKKIYKLKSDKKYFSNNNSNCYEYSFHKLNNNEYLLKNLIIKIEYNK